MNDYIKRVDAIEQLKADMDSFDHVRPEVVDYFVRGLMSVPVADATEVKHGRWDKVYIHESTYVKCSECGVMLVWEDGIGMGEALVGEEYARYCPCCGAKMDGEEQEHESNREAD